MSSAWEHARTLDLLWFVPLKWCSLESIPLGWDDSAWYMLILWPRVKEQYPSKAWLPHGHQAKLSTYKASAHITSTNIPLSASHMAKPNISGVYNSTHNRKAFWYYIAKGVAVLSWGNEELKLITQSMTTAGLFNAAFLHSLILLEIREYVWTLSTLQLPTFLPPTTSQKNHRPLISAKPNLFFDLFISKEELPLSPAKTHSQALSYISTAKSQTLWFNPIPAFSLLNLHPGSFTNM